MAKRRKGATTKSKVGKTRAKLRKKTVKRAAARRTKKSAKARAAKASRGEVSKRIQARQQKPGATPVVEKTVIDVVDEPLPGIVRVTEIEETEVSAPDSDQAEE